MNMKKYVKKPIEIEALQWTGANHREMFDFLENKTDQHMTAFGDNFRIDHSKVEGGLVIKTLEGEHIASIGDFIIKGVKGEFYPCKPDVFELTYQNTSRPTSLPSDWTKQCSCNPDDKTGETWCCNTCGKPTIRLSTGLPSDEEIEGWLMVDCGGTSEESAQIRDDMKRGAKWMRSIAAARIAEVEDDNKQLRLLLTQYSEFRAECTALNDPAIIEIDDKIFPF